MVTHKARWDDLAKMKYTMQRALALLCGKHRSQPEAWRSVHTLCCAYRPYKLCGVISASIKKISAAPCVY